ncbi:hypothetical protein GW17_00047542 [Ensete ventricosum]|nr:hypothetical protein GW17_00047542 [Ensete ventricosum]
MCTSCSLRLLWKRTSAGHLKTEEEAPTREGAFCRSRSGVLPAEFDSAEEGTSEVEMAGGKHGGRQGPCVAHKGVQANMSRAISQLRAFLRVLLLKFLDLLFRFFNRFYHEKLPFFAAMVTAPKFVAMPTKALRRSVSGMNWLGGRKGDRSRLRFRVDSLRFRLLLVLQFEGVMETGKDFDGSGLRLGRKV